MDNQDREFEALLKTFQLRSPSPFPAETAQVRRDRPHVRWAIAAVAAVALVVIGAWIYSMRGPFAIVEIAGDSSYKAGQRIGLRTPIESGARESFAWSLDDGSRVEMRAESRALLESDDEGTGLRLNRGSVLVSAAKQKAGHFHVVTRDARVVVTGTTFLVEVQSAGTRVGVLEGVVEVRTDNGVKKLRQGEQFTTDAAETLNPLAQAIAWSRRVSEFTAFLNPSTKAPEPIVAFTPAPPPRLTRTEVIPIPERPQDAPLPAPPQTAPPQPAPEPAPAPEKKEPPSAAGAEGPGAEIMARACGQCHRADITPSQPYASREAVEALVSRQMSFGAQVKQSEFPILVDYLLKYYSARRK